MLNVRGGYYLYAEICREIARGGVNNPVRPIVWTYAVGKRVRISANGEY